MFLYGTAAYFILLLELHLLHEYMLSLWVYVGITVALGTELLIRTSGAWCDSLHLTSLHIVK